MADRDGCGRFVKGVKAKGQGRPKGSQSRFTKTFKSMIEGELERLGPEHLHEWALGNPGDFYKVAARLIPQSRELSGPDGKPVEHREVHEYTTEELYRILECG